MMNFTAGITNGATFKGTSLQNTSTTLVGVVGQDALAFRTVKPATIDTSIDVNALFPNYDSNPISFALDALGLDYHKNIVTAEHIIETFTGPTRDIGTAGGGGGGGAGITAYTHTQSGLATTWTVVHGLGRAPTSASAYVANVEVTPRVEIVDTNTVRFIFNKAVSGTAYIV